MNMKKRTIFILVCSALFVAFIILGVVLVSKELESAHIVAERGTETQNAILALSLDDPEYASKKAALENSFVEFYTSKNAAQTAMTLGALASFVAGIVAMVLAVKGVGKIIKEKKSVKQKD